MGTRISLGKGFTLGRSGLRYGHSIPGVPRGWVSTGASGTLIAGGPLRHWEPARQRGAGGGTNQRCWGFTRAGDQCANRATLGLTCRIHEGQAEEAGERREAFLAANPQPAKRRAQWQGRHYLALILMVGLIWGFSAVLTRIDADYARTHDDQGQPIAPPRKTPIDCATDPIAPYVYACTDHPAIPAPYRGR